MECDTTTWAGLKEMMMLYLDTAKTFTNLSAAALGLTVVFREKIAGIRPGAAVDFSMLGTWLLFLLAIGAGAFYQYLAVKYLEWCAGAEGYMHHMDYLVKNPGKMYGVMLTLFFAAAAMLVVTAWKNMPRGSGKTVGASDSIGNGDTG